jgi:uncharacterized protein (TIGR03382 family)
MNRQWLRVACLAIGVAIAAPGTVSAGTVTLSPDPLEFGDVVVGTTRDLTLAVASAGGATTVNGLSGAGGQCSRFTFPGNPFPLNVPDGASRNVTVRFTPSARGAAACTLTTTVGGGDTAGSVAASGNGTQAAMTTTLEDGGDFGGAEVGGSRTLTLTISNDADADPLTVTVDISQGADQFTVEAGPIAPIPAGASTMLLVTYTPTTRGDHSGQLRIRTSSGGNAEDLYALTGTGLQSEIQLTAPTFADVIVGGPTPFATATANVRNAGNTSFFVDQMTLSAGDLTFDDATLACTGGTSCDTDFTVAAAPSTGRNVRLRCTPTALGVRSATLTVVSGADIGTSTVQVSCRGVTPILTVDPDQIAFGDVRTGTTSPGRTLRVSNGAGANSAPLIYSSAVTGAGFAATSTMCTTATCTLQPGEFDDFTITFAPTARGAVTGAFTITSNDPDTAALAVALTGTGVRSVLTVDTPADGSLELGNVVMPTPGTSGPGTITISNTGNENLRITSVALSGTHAADFDITSGQTGADTVAPDGERSWTVTCTPAIPGDRTATLTIANDSPTPNRAITITCSGRGGRLTTVASVAFGQVPVDTVATRTITVTNQGNVTARISALTVVGDRFAASLVSGTLPFDVAPAGEVQVRVTFSPLTGDPLTGSLVIENNGVTQPTVALSGDGTTGLEISPSPIAFGDVRVGTAVTQLITVTNSGQATLAVYQAQVEGAAGFTVVGFTQRNLNPDQSMQFSVRAQLTAMGAATGTLRVRARVQPGNDEVAVAASVTATGVVPEVNISTGDSAPTDAVLDFGGVDIDQDAVTQTVTISNTGTGAFALTSCALTRPAAFRLSAVPNQCNRPVLPGTSVNVDVVFEPTAEQAFPVDGPTTPGSLLTIATDLTPISIALTGIGVDRHIAVSPLTVSFGAVYRDPTAPVTREITVTNTIDRDDGLQVGAPLRLSMVMPDDPAFTIVSMSDPDMSIAPGQSSTIVVGFAPPTAGAFSGDLVIMNDDDEAPIARVALDGTGIVRGVAVPMSIDVGAIAVGVPLQLSALARQLELVNGSGDGYVVRDIAIRPLSGGEVGSFRLVGFAPGTALPAGGRLLVDLEIAVDQPGPFELAVDIFLDGDDEALGVAAETMVPVIRGTAVEVEFHGGGCSAGGDDGAGAIVVVLGLGLALVRRRAAAAAALAVLAAPLAARADGGNVDLATFSPAPTTEAEMIHVEAAGVGVAGAWSLGLAFNYAQNPFQVTSVDGQVMDTALVGDRIAAELGFAYAITDRIEAGIMVPLLQQSAPEPALANLTPADGTALGDIALHAKAHLAGTRSAGFALAATVHVPTASGDQYAGAGLAGGLRAIASAERGRLGGAINAGFLGRGTSSFGPFEQGSQLTYGAAGSLRAADALSVIGELYGNAAVTGTSSTALEWLLGLRWRPTAAIGLAAGAGTGILDGAGASDFRGFVMLSFSPRAREREPLSAVDRERINERRDDDHDGVPLATDGCPVIAEDKDGFEDDDGCPDPDNDGDGVLDIDDKCVGEAEDRDGMDDGDGCPDGDNDKDGIPDHRDQCPTEEEDKDGFKDDDGCDEPDNDLDGIADVVDRCPLEAEVINGKSDDDGCPDAGDSLVMIAPDRIEILEPVLFAANSAKIQKKSFNVLGQVAATLRAAREFKRVRVTVYVHPRNSRDQELSAKRAEAVRAWLVQWGVEPERIEARGLGSTKPLVPATQRGAEQVNDRVEFILLEKN